MAPFTLHLLRHGEPEIAGTMLGWTDCPSTAAGIAICVEQVRDLGIEAIVSSDLCRCAHAALAIGNVLRLPTTTDPRWRELNFGDWDGLAAGAIEPAALGAFWSDPDANPAPNGERWSKLTGRVSEAIADLMPSTTLVVAHGGSIRAALAVLCGFELRQLWAFELPYAAVLSLKVWPGEQPSAQIVGLWP